MGTTFEKLPKVYENPISLLRYSECFGTYYPETPTEAEVEDGEGKCMIRGGGVTY